MFTSAKKQNQFTALNERDGGGGGGGGGGGRNLQQKNKEITCQVGSLNMSMGCPTARSTCTAQSLMSSPKFTLKVQYLCKFLSLLYYPVLISFQPKHVCVDVTITTTSINNKNGHCCVALSLAKSEANMPYKKYML